MDSRDVDDLPAPPAPPAPVVGARAARRLDAFQKLALATTATTYGLILVGGLVRAVGAGMGCPDWPKCFGRWVPPTRAEDLPPGFDPAAFNAALTWTEYLNRLLGVVTGLLIFATLVAAIAKHRRSPRVLWPAVVAFVAVGYEGWLGGRVVAHDLAPWIVTAHLVGALVVVGALLYATIGAFLPPVASPRPERRRLSYAAAGLVALTLLQIGLGTQVRGFLDDLQRARPSAARLDVLIDVPRALDLAHRQLAVVVLAACVALLVVVVRRRSERPIRVAAIAVVALAGAQIAAGLVLVYVDMAPAIMIAHLTIGALLLGAQTVLAILPLRLPSPFLAADGASS